MPESWKKFLGEMARRPGAPCLSRSTPQLSYSIGIMGCSPRPLPVWCLRGSSVYCVLCDLPRKAVYHVTSSGGLPQFLPSSSSFWKLGWHFLQLLEMEGPKSWLTRHRPSSACCPVTTKCVPFYFPKCQLFTIRCMIPSRKVNLVELYLVQEEIMKI